MCMYLYMYVRRHVRLFCVPVSLLFYQVFLCGCVSMCVSFVAVGMYVCVREREKEHVYVFVCLWLCVCVCVRERERAREEYVFVCLFVSV